MKELLIFITVAVVAATAAAQVPYFASTVGDGRVYGYTSVKVRPAEDSWQSYTTFQYGVGNSLAFGADVSTLGPSVNYGLLARATFFRSKRFNVGAQVTPSFSITDGLRFSSLTGAIYMNGDITADGRLFWTANTWLAVNRHASPTYDQWLYAGYSIPLGSKSITPMAGMIYSWEFDRKADAAAGAYFSSGKWNFYLWADGLARKHQRLVVGVDFAI